MDWAVCGRGGVDDVEDDGVGCDDVWVELSVVSSFVVLSVAEVCFGFDLFFFFFLSPAVLRCLLLSTSPSLLFVLDDDSAENDPPRGTPFNRVAAALFP
jgi:hypothetical protein